jgi:predicted Rossmann fold flavoprotein
MKTKIAIIGGGPAGVFCALQLLLGKKDIHITIFEKDLILKTLLPTGGGRCNLSYEEFDNISLAKNYPRGEKFLYSIFAKYGTAQTLEYFEKIGIKTYSQPDKRIFPLSNSSKDFRKKLLDELKKHKNVEIIKKEIRNIQELEEYEKIVIATGSKGGYKLSCAYGHTITPLKPALCGYITKQKYPAGVVLNIGNEPLLFTHQGISGPFVYKHSSLNAFEPFPRELNIPLLDIALLENEIKKTPKKSFGNIVSEFIPKSLAKCLIKNFDAQGCQIKKEEIENLKTLTFEILSLDNKGEIVTAGGVSLKEIDNFCRSKINDKLYFCGEILDIDGFCGGFNLQACWSCGSVAADGILSTL